MPLDINAFRSIAAQSPDKLVYVQDGALRTTKNQAHHGAHTYKAATDAFIKAYTDHYGVKLGDALQRHLQADGNVGTPLTARKIKALVAFADEKMGSATSVDAGGRQVDLETLGLDKMRRVGFSRNTKLANAAAGQQETAASTLQALKFGKDGKVDHTAMLRHINTFRAYIGREVAARHIADVRPSPPMDNPNVPAAPQQAPRESDAALETARLFERGLFTAIDAMDNKELSDVYQGLISGGTDAFKKELTRIVNHPDAKPATARLAEQAFADLCRIEAMVVSEISRRMAIDRAPTEAEKAAVPSLMERYAGAEAAAANRFGGEKDMTTVNLGILANRAAKGSNSSKVSAGKVDATLKSHGMGAAEARKIGDMLRSQELTINMKFAALMGYSRTGEKKPSLFKRQNAHIVNTFESKELQNRDPLGTGDLKHRDQVEKTFFPEYAGKPIAGRDRPVYGALNTQKYTSGGADTQNATYGRVVVVMKPHVKRRCTFSLDDTFFGIKMSMPTSRRAEIEEKLVAAFAGRLKDPGAALAALRSPDSPIADNLNSFFNSFGRFTKFDVQSLVNVSDALEKFFVGHVKNGEQPMDSEEIISHFIDNYGDKERARSSVANYDNIENLLAQKADFTAVNFGVAQLRQQENPKSPIYPGESYIEAQIHGPVLLEEDVEEIRIDTEEMEEHFGRLFAKLPEEEKAGLDRDEWVRSRCDEAKAEILNDTRNAPFKVTFYNSDETSSVDDMRYSEAMMAQSSSAVGHMKERLVARGNALLGERRAELIEHVKANAKGDVYSSLLAFAGGDLANLPDWIVEEADRVMRQKIDTAFGVQIAVTDEEKVLDSLSRTFRDFLVRLVTALNEMDAQHIDDPVRRERILKEVVRLHAPTTSAAEAIVRLDVAASRALDDLAATVRETFEKDIEDGAQLMQQAFAGVPPVAGAAENAIRQRIQNEIRAMQKEIISQTSIGDNNLLENLSARIRRKAVKPFVEKKARIMREQTTFEFPSTAERNAFLTWAVSAGKLKNQAQFKGVYEASSELTDAFEAKLKGNAPLAAQDILDCYKAFAKTASKWMIEDEKAQGALDYGADDRESFFDRIASVALSRLATRVGNEPLARIAAALDTPDGRWLYHAMLSVPAVDGGDLEAPETFGTAETAAAFLEALVRRLPQKYGFKASSGDPRTSTNINYSVVPPFARAFVAQINPKIAAQMEKDEPYDASKAGPRFLVGVPAPANAQAMPQTNAQRKEFLLGVLPTYREHERTFDKGTNYHGRTHATRSFVLSIAMGNILKEKGVRVDLNAVALGTAGHDTGRTANHVETTQSEERSAENVANAVENRYPGAAGFLWTEQVKSNITTKRDDQTTVEGYLLRSADSLDYWRIDELDENKFPFLQKSILTDDGILVVRDGATRRQLMKESKLLTELTSPRVRFDAERKQLEKELDEMPDGPEFNAKNARLQELEQQMHQAEIDQTENLSDEQIVELVENAIRSRPQDFPLLTKYYLNA